MSTDSAFVSTRPQIKIAGTENTDLAEALTALAINLPLCGIAHAEIKVTNWIATGDTGEHDYGFQSIGLGESLEILIEQEDTPVPLFKGEVTALEESYGEGAPQLTILAQDKLHRLARTRHSRVFEEQSLDDVINSIASGAGLTADVSLSSTVATYHQLNESDMAFVLRLSGSLDIAARLQGDQLRVKPEQADGNPVELNAQDSALKIRLIADLNQQPRSIKVKGYNLDNDQEVNETGDSLRDPASHKTAASTLSDLGWDGEEIVPQPFPRAQGEAEALAKGHFNRAAKRFISGDIQAIGEAALRSGREIELSHVSPRFAGRYQVIHCLHQFNSASGFETHLKVNKADWQP
ncbi:MAG TPA: contractile injection system protein, VgrG/Pvc8 family [Cellvibrio sp.]|nr:contractile injection system protein, VgrG/Pvc8 family [Cellvibrio sp.]